MQYAKKIVISLLAVLMALLPMTGVAHAEEDYELFLLDYYETLTIDEANEVALSMAEVTQYCHVILGVTEDNPFYDPEEHKADTEEEDESARNDAIKQFSDMLYEDHIANRSSKKECVVLVLDKETFLMRLDAFGWPQQVLDRDFRQDFYDEIIPLHNEEGLLASASRAMELIADKLKNKGIPTDFEDVKTEYKNTETGFATYVFDYADLFSEAQISKLYKEMEDVTQYANAVVCTIDFNPFGYSEHSTRQELEYCSNLYDQLFSKMGGEYESAVIFLIDMHTRWLYIYREGPVKKKITESICDSITDNVYKYASDRDYYACASKAMNQIYRVLNDEKIAQPMKLISNLLIALVIAFVITYFLASTKSKAKTPADAVLLSYAVKNYQNGIVHDELTNTTKTYNPRSSSSSGGGGHRSGGGGGHHGGGGGHRF